MDPLTNEEIKNIMNNLEAEALRSSTCQKKKVGAKFIFNRHSCIEPGGFSGPPEVLGQCNPCVRKNSIPYSDFTGCNSVHAEFKVLMKAYRFYGPSMSEGVLFVTHLPCYKCSIDIIYSGIKLVYYRYDAPDEYTKKIIELFERAKVILRKVE
jgi:dCMP deaminase